MELKKLELLKIRAFRLQRQREREGERFGRGLETWKRNREYGQATGKEGRKKNRDVSAGDPCGLR